MNGIVFISRSIIGLIIFFISSSLSANTDNDLLASVVHWWSHPAEQQAVKTLQNAFEDQGGTWQDLGAPYYADARKRIVERLAYGYAPTIMQWNAGREMYDFYELGLLNQISAINNTSEYQYYDFVEQAVFMDGQQIAIPVNLHTENWLWINKHIYDRHLLKPPTSWDQLIEQMQLLADRGETPIAIGNEGWQLRVLFNSILLGKLGREGYERFYVDRVVNHQLYGGLWQVLNIFQTISRILGEEKQDQSWYEATMMVAEEEAALQFMGDWAKAELSLQGLKAGVDYYCEFAPGTEHELLHVVDVFLMGKNKQNNFIEVQKKFLQTVSAPDIQAEFSIAKGAVPVLKGIDRSLFDQCAQRVMDIRASSDTVIPPFASVTQTEFIDRLYTILIELWTEPSDAGVNISLNRMIELLNKSKL